MPDVLLRPEPRTARRGSVAGAAVLACAVALMLMIAVAQITTLPSGVDLEVVNPHPYHLNVAVSDARGAGWLSVGTVRRNRAAAYQEVIDQGVTWRFRFTYAGVEAGEVIVNRGTLQHGGWTLTVPDHIAERLAAEGLAPSAT